MVIFKNGTTANAIPMMTKSGHGGTKDMKATQGVHTGFGADVQSDHSERGEENRSADSDTQARTVSSAQLSLVITWTFPEGHLSWTSLYPSLWGRLIED